MYSGVPITSPVWVSLVGRELGPLSLEDTSPLSVLAPVEVPSP